MGVAVGRWAQNLVTAAKVAALAGVVGGRGLRGTRGRLDGPSLPDAPTGLATWAALAVAFQAVIWTYYGYPDAAKIAEEIDDPDRRLPRIFLFGILGITALYLLLNAAFLQVLPFERIACVDAGGRRRRGRDLRRPGRSAHGRRWPCWWSWPPSTATSSSPRG